MDLQELQALMEKAESYYKEAVTPRPTNRENLLLSSVAASLLVIESHLRAIKKNTEDSKKVLSSIAY